MFRLTLTFLFCLCTLIGAFGQQAIELKDVMNGVFYPRNIANILPIPGDGEHYTQMNADHTQVVKYSFKTGQQVEVLFDATTARECPFKRFDSYSFSPDGSKLLIATETSYIYRRTYKAEHYLYSLKRNIEGKINNVVERLSEGGPQQAPVFSPDGNMVAFVRENNIFLVKLLYGNSESQVTEDGKRNEVLNGIPDWVYEEEFSMNRALEFSADSKMLAFIRWDESQVPMYSFPLFAGEYPRHEALAKYPGEYTYKYPKTGEVNSTVSVHSFDIKSKVTRKMQVPLDADGYIPRIFFTRNPNQLAIVTLNRHQNLLNIFLADPRSTVCKELLRDESDTYISENALNQIKFYDDHFSYLSERTGYSHLYWCSLTGTQQKAITSGNYEVIDFLGYSEADGSFYFTSNEESPMCKAIYKVDRKGRKTKLSSQQGTNSAIFSSNMKYYVNRFQNLSTPTVITLNDCNGRELTTLLDNADLKEKLTHYAMPQKEFFSFTTGEGVQLNGWMMMPCNFDANRKYPVLMYQYSGPGSQQVLDQFSISWETYMA